MDYSHVVDRESFIKYYHESLKKNNKYFIDGVVNDMETPKETRIHGSDVVLILQLSNGDFRLSFPKILRTDYIHYPRMVSKDEFLKRMKEISAPEDMIHNVIEPPQLAE